MISCQYYSSKSAERDAGMSIVKVELETDVTVEVEDLNKVCTFSDQESVMVRDSLLYDILTNSWLHVLSVIHIEHSRASIVCGSSLFFVFCYGVTTVLAGYLKLLFTLNLYFLTGFLKNVYSFKKNVNKNR